MVGSISESRFSEAQCVVAGRPVEQAGGGVDEAPGAHRGHQRDRCALLPDPVEVLGVAQQASGAVSTGVDQDVEGRGVVEGVVGTQDEVLRADDVGPAGGQARDRPAVLGVVPGPVREDLPGADGVELLDAVEEEEPDVALRGGVLDADGVGGEMGSAW